MKIKVSFDFDDTLSLPHIRKYAKELIKKGYEVWVVTRRFEKLEDYSKDFLDYYNIKDIKREHSYLYEVINRLGIPRSRVHFCNMEDKYKFFQDNNDFIWHLDDDLQETNDINQHCDVVAVNHFKGDFKKQCNKLIEDFKFNTIK